MKYSKSTFSQYYVIFMKIQDSYHGEIQVTRQEVHVNRLKTPLSLSFIHPLCTSSSLEDLNESCVTQTVNIKSDKRRN